MGGSGGVDDANVIIFPSCLHVKALSCVVAMTTHTITLLTFCRIINVIGDGKWIISSDV